LFIFPNFFQYVFKYILYIQILKILLMIMIFFIIKSYIYWMVKTFVLYFIIVCCIFVTIIKRNNIILLFFLELYLLYKSQLLCLFYFFNYWIEMNRNIYIVVFNSIFHIFFTISLEKILSCSFLSLYFDEIVISSVIRLLSWFLFASMLLSLVVAIFILFFFEIH